MAKAVKEDAVNFHSTIPLWVTGRASQRLDGDITFATVITLEAIAPRPNLHSPATIALNLA